ncbi:MAG: Spy/CpxP family protein refolding chaperone [Desulfosarcinaceae bacterium]|jgi:Spy/CpxP family protein refolding chaperone
MKKNRTRHIVTLLVIVGLVGFGSTAMAYRGWGRGNPDCPGYGAGFGPGYRHGGGPYADLTDEQRTQLDQARKAFLDETKDLHAQLRDKADALHELLDTDSVDTAAAADLQKEISDLRAQLDQKRLAHRIEMRQLFPELGNGPRHWGGRGYGHGRHLGMGRW